MTELAALAGGYLAGSIPWAFLVGRLHGVDLRRTGSGNVGTGNVYELAGFGWAFLVFLLDSAKALLAVFLAGAWAGEAAQVAAGWGVIVGHSWPVWLRLVGGRGQLVTLVAGGVIAPWGTLSLLPILGIGAALPPTPVPGERGGRTQLAPASLLAVLVYPLLALLFDGALAAGYAAGAAVLAVVRRLQGSAMLRRTSFREAWRTRLIQDREP